MFERRAAPTYLLALGLVSGLTACGGDDTADEGSGEETASTEDEGSTGETTSSGETSESGSTGDGDGDSGEESESTGDGDGGDGDAGDGDSTDGGDGDTSGGDGDGGGDGDSGGDGDGDSETRLRVMHAGVGVSDVDVFADSATPAIESGLEYRDGSGYQLWDPGDNSFQVSATGDTPANAVVQGGPFTFSEGADTTLVAIGVLADQTLELFTVDDDASGLDSSQMRLNFVHAAPSFASVNLIDLTMPSSPAALWSGAAYKSQSDVDRTPGFLTWGLDTDNNNQPDFTYDVYLSGVSGGTLLDVFLVDDAEDTATPSLAVLYPDANGTVTIIEPNESECRYYVDQANGDDAAHGLTWANAKQTLQAAIAQTNPITNPGLGPCEIWVAEGTYHPTSGTSRGATFTLWNEVSLYGGFAGDETSIDQRDIQAHPTILSGDIGVADDDSDNSHHVITAYTDTRLDGVQVRDGNSNGLDTEDARHGAGIRALGMITVANATVADNRTGDGFDDEIGSSGGGFGGCGAGIWVGAGTVRVENSRIENNVTGDGGASTQGGHGGDGAGLCVTIAYDIQIYDSVFASNTTGGGGDGSMIGGYGGNGAGVYIESATGPVVIRGSRFEDNLTGPGSPTGSTLMGAQGWGGGLTYGTLGTTGSLHISDSIFTRNQARIAAAMSLGGTGASEPIELMNLIVYDNEAVGSGGGIRVTLNGTVAFRLSNSLVVGNSAGTHSGGIFYNPSNETAQSGQPTEIVNSIIWGNTAPEHPQMRATKGSLPQPQMLLDHVDMQGGCLNPSQHNVTCGQVVDVDPLFVNEGAGDLQLQNSSTLIDAGDATLMPEDLLDIDGDLMTTGDPWPYDYTGADRVSGANVDLGPYEQP